MPKKKFFIEALEQRIMLDGAGASTFLDVVDESNKEKLSTKNSKEIAKFKEVKTSDTNDLPFINITRDKARKKQIVFIDTQITDYDSLTSSFDKNTKVVLIDANEDGFKKIEQTLEGEKNYSAIHIIGHGSAGQILFGNALLSNENIDNYNSTLKNIGQTLTSNGDILFYGCNVAANEKGENLIKRISKITKADIAASDDITGNGGDWVLEKKIGIIETKNVQALEYNHSLGTADAYGIASIDTSTTEENHSATNFKAQSGSGNNNGQQSSSNKFIITQERSVVTSGSSLSFDVSAATSSITPSSSNPINVYMLYLNDVENRRAFSDRGQVTFEHEILGVFTEWDNTIFMSGISKSGATYPDSSGTKVSKRTLEWYNGASSSYVGPGIAGSKDYFIISNSNKTISVGADNGLHGDFLRIITRASPPSAVADTGYVNEGDTLSVSNSASAVSGTSNGSHSGDISDNDTDQVTQAGSTVSTNHTLTITSYSHTSATNTSGGSASSGNGNSGTAGSNSVVGYYGTLDLEANGSYTYTASNDITGLDSGETVTDVFTYTVGDGVTTDTATITITIIGQSDNNAPTASNSTVYINENNQVSSAGDRTPANITKIFAAGDFNYSDADSDSLSKVKITTLESAGALEHYNGSSWVDVTLNQEISASDIGNNYLRFTPAANSESNVTFGFKVNDGTVYSSSAYTMTISVNAAPNVTDTTVGTTVAAGNNSTGDVHDGVADSDDADSVLVVTGVASGNESSNNSIITNDTGVGSAIAGTYGTLTIAADGTYTYAASSTNNITYGSTATDTFTYTTRDNETNSGSFAYDVGTITFTVASSIVLVNDTDSVNENETVTKTGAQADVLDDDAADTSGLSVTHIKVTGGSNSTVSSGTTYLDGTSVTGTYGTLTIGADGSYTYIANTSNAEALAAGGDPVTDSFTYTADGATATLIITVTGVNDAPVAQNDEGVIVEDGTLTVSNGNNANVTGSYDATGEHSGDVIDTSSSSHKDSDVDTGASLTVSAISTLSGTTGSIGSALTGTYGELTIAANGSYSYVANQAAADALDAADQVTDVFTYTLSDGTATATANITITIIGINDDPTAVNDTGYIKEGGTLTVANSGSAVSGTSTGSNSGDITDNDTDLDDSSTATITLIQHSGAGSATSVADVTYTNGSATSVSGTYGTLTIGSDGSYKYVANSNITSLDAGDSNVTDVFTYTVSDGTATDTATLTITVIPSQDVTARNDTGTINEDGTLTVSNGGNATSVTGVSQDTGSPYAIDEGTVRSVAFNHDGTKMFVLHHHTNPKISVHALTTAFDINTASQSSTTDISSYAGNPRGIRFNDDGSKLYISNGSGSNKKIHEFALSTAYDVSSLPTPTSTVISGQDGNPRGFAFNTDGTKMFLLGDINDSVYEYSLSTAFDTSTISYTSRSLDFSAKEATPRGISFNATGTKLFITGQASDKILEYDLSTGFNLSTATFKGEFDVSSYADSSTDIIFNNDGTKAFLSRASNNGVLSFSLSSPYSFVDITGENTGDVIDTSSTSNYDTDPDSDTLTVTAIRKGSTEGSGDSESVGSAIDGTYGQLTIQANGSYTYVANKTAADQLDAGDVVTDSFNYTVSDGQGETDIAVLEITVIGINDAPVGVNDTDAVNENATITESSGSELLVADDTDVDASSSLTVTQIKVTVGGTNSAVNPGTTHANGTSITGTYGTLVVGANGAYTYTANTAAAEALDASDVVTDNFTYTVSDGTATSTATLIITVTGVNDAPVAVADTDAVLVTATVTDTTNGAGTVISDDTDADADSSLTVTHIQHSGAGSASAISSGTTRANGTSSTGTYGTLTIGANGTYSYVAGSSAGTDVFTYTVSDGTASTTTTLTITVSNDNNAPVAVNDTDSVNEDATVSQTSGSGLLVADDTDADGDTLTVSHITATGGTNSTVADSSTSASNGTTVTGTYGTLTVGADGSYTYTADQSAADALDAGETAPDSFTYTISDGKGGTATATLIITVTGTNDTPVATNDTGSVNEDATLTVSSAGSGVIQDNDTDADGDDTAASLVITQIKPYSGSNSSVTSGTTHSNGTSVTGTYGTLTIGADGTYTYTADQSAADDLDASDTVPDVFTYTVTDTTGATTTADITITVTGVNDAPTASDNTVTTLEDTNHVFSTSEFNFSDVDDDGALNKIKITSLEDNGALQYYNGSAWVDVTLNQEITATDISNNKLRFVPDANENGTSYTSFGFQVSDGTAYSSSSNTMTVNVTPVNDAPVGVNDTDAVVEDATVSQTSGSGLLVADDTDVDGDTLTVTQISVTDSGSNSAVSSGTDSTNGTSITGTYGTLVVGADGTYTYVADQAAADALDASETATDSFTYTVSDGNGGTATATLIITVTGANDDPVATDDTGSVNEDATLTVSDAANGVIQNNDTDADGDDTVSSLEITQIAVTGGSNSSVTSGTNQSNGTSVTGTYGTLTIGADGTYTYVADQSAADDLATGETAPDSFTYTVSDGNGGTDTATIVITVTGTNDAPTAADKTIYINENNNDGTHGARTSLNITYRFSDSGSEFNFSDVDDSDTLSKIKIISVPTYGTLTKVGNGNTITANTTITNFDNIKYTPNANSENDDTFTFKVHDGTVFSSATYTMNISVNAAPVAVDDTDTITAGASAATGSVTTNDTDSDDNTSDLKVRGVGTGAEGSSLANKNVGSALSGTYGTFTLNQDGSYSYDVTGNAATIALADGATATDTFSYKVRDDETNAGSKAIDIGTITFTITGINEGPTAVNDTITISTGVGSATVTNGSADDLDGNDSDGDGDSLTITNFAAGSTEGSGTTFTAGSEITGTYGTLTLNADGSYSYTISSTLTDDESKNAGSDPVYDNFWYTISDGNSTDTAVLQIKIIFPAVTGGGNENITDPTPDGDDDTETETESDNKGKKNKEERREKRQRRSEKIDTPELELPPSTQRDGAEFNQGLRLVDLVAESESISTGDDSAVIENLKAKYTKDGMKVKFKVFNDDGKEMNKYYGEMKDGSVLPNWIKVDPKTGKTTTNIPKGMGKVEFKIIALDADNNQKKVTVVIDPKKLAQDKDVFKKIKKAKKTKVNVDTSGTVQLQSTNEAGSIDKTTTDVLNNNNKLTEFIDIAPSEILNVETQIIDNKYYLELPIVKVQNSEEFEIVQEDGQKLPEWIKIDPFTGQIIAEPPSDVENIKLKIISENEGGEVVIKEVQLDFNNQNNNTEKLTDPETTFEPLNTQLAKAQVNFDDYGDKLLRSL